MWWLRCTSFTFSGASSHSWLVLLLDRRRRPHWRRHRPGTPPRALLSAAQRRCIHRRHAARARRRDCCSIACGSLIRDEMHVVCMHIACVDSKPQRNESSFVVFLLWVLRPSRTFSNENRFQRVLDLWAAGNSEESALNVVRGHTHRAICMPHEHEGRIHGEPVRQLASHRPLCNLGSRARSAPPRRASAEGRCDRRRRGAQHARSSARTM